MKHKYVIRLLQKQIRAFDRAAEDAGEFAAKEYIAQSVLIHAAISDLTQASMHPVAMAEPIEYYSDVKQAKLTNEIEEFIADHEIRNPHYLPDEQIIKEFAEKYEVRRIKQALKELR